MVIATAELLTTRLVTLLMSAHEPPRKSSGCRFEGFLDVHGVFRRLRPVPVLTVPLVQRPSSSEYTWKPSQDPRVVWENSLKGYSPKERKMPQTLTEP